jgi:Tol biopolymer transport system component
VAKVEGNVVDGYHVLLDGVPGPRYAEIAKETPIFSANGRSIAYAARKGLDWTWVVNGVEGPFYPELTPTSFAFSADGEHHAYVVIPRYRHTILVVDGEVRAEGSWDGIMPWDAAPVLNADGSRLAFVETNQKERKMRVNLDGKAGPWRPGIAMIKSLGFGAYNANAFAGSVQTRLATPVVDERARPNIFNMVFSPDGKRFVYGTFTDEGRPFLVVDGKDGLPHDHLGFDNVFSPDSRKHAYMALDGERRCIFTQGAEPMVIDAIFDWSLTFSPDGRHLAFAGIRDGKKAVWLDGKQVPCEVAFENYHNQRPIVFSPDSKRIAFAARSETTEHWVVDGKPGPGSPFGTGFGLSFSPDSRHFAYMFAKGTGPTAVVVVDGVERASYTPLTSGPVFRKDGVLEFIAADDGALRRIEVSGF